MDVFTGLLLIFLGYGGGRILHRNKTFQWHKLKRVEAQADEFFEEAKKMYEEELKELLKAKAEYPLGEDEWKEIYKAESGALETLEKLRRVFIQAKERMRYEPYEKLAQLFDDWLDITHINNKIWTYRNLLSWPPNDKVADEYGKSIEECYLVKDELEKRILDYLK
ncbi:MAG: hypothetical protein ABIG91_00315 [Patescibacteria group bacterium]